MRKTFRCGTTTTKTTTTTAPARTIRLTSVRNKTLSSTPSIMTTKTTSTITAAPASATT